MKRLLKYFQHDGIGVGADGVRPLELLGAREQQVVLGGQFRLPAGLDHDGLVRLDNDCGTFDARSGFELLAGVDIRLMPSSGWKEISFAALVLATRCAIVLPTSR